MHSYSIDNNSRKSVILGIVLISVIINMFLYTPFEELLLFLSKKYACIQCVLDVLNRWGVGINFLTVLALFTIIYLCYCKFIWKWKFVQKIHSVPNLSGKWKGTLITSFLDENGKKKEMDVTLKIKQDWNKISIRSSFITSESCSKTASLYSDSNEGIVLTFTYNNAASGNVDWKSKMHTGCNILTLLEENDILEGYYFTNRGVNGTQGSIKVKKIK